MLQLDVNEEEREILVDVLDNYLSELRMEISNTDGQDVREMLKKRNAALEMVRATASSSAAKA